MPAKDRESQFNNVARNPNSKPAKPQKGDFDMLHIRRVVAGNPNTPAKVLDRLSQDPFSIIRRHVAGNPRTPKDILRRLAMDQDLDVRLAVAENTHTPPDTLAILASDHNVDVRFGVAENPHMPEDLLIALSKDDNPYVRFRAFKTLQMLSPDVQLRVQLMVQEQFAPKPEQRGT